MARWNSIILEGNIGKEPQVKSTMTSFSLAVWQGKDKPTMWLMCKAFQVPVLANKGDKVRVTGRLYYETWMSQEGTEKSNWGVIVETVERVEKQDPKKPEPQTQTDDCPF